MTALTPGPIHWWRSIDHPLGVLARHAARRIGTSRPAQHRQHAARGLSRQRLSLRSDRGEAERPALPRPHPQEGQSRHGADETRAGDEQDCLESALAGRARVRSYRVLDGRGWPRFRRRSGWNARVGASWCARSGSSGRRRRSGRVTRHTLCGLWGADARFDQSERAISPLDRAEPPCPNHGGRSHWLGKVDF